MSFKDSLGERMKGYEQVAQTRLMRREPVIIRIDGKAFHSFCKGFEKPFDKIMVKTMQDTTKYLCENIQGCVLGYTQSDEITLLLKDWQSFETSAWFDNKVQKMVSISASMATLAFNKHFSENIQDYGYNCCIGSLGCEVDKGQEENFSRYSNIYLKKTHQAMFDSRVFNLSKEEVCNNFIWRQQDAVRNSIQSLAQSLYSHKELHGINTQALQNKMFTEKGINWNELPTELKRGSCCVKIDGKWAIDKNIPFFTRDRDYIDNLLT